MDYAYHSGSGLLHTVTGSDSVVYATFTGYNAAGKMGQIDYGNGAQTLFAYYPQTTRLETIWTEDASDNLLHNKTYHYSPAGDISRIANGLTSTTYTYAYDALHRLTGETNDANSDAYAYSYNAIGNTTARTVTGSSNYAFSYSAYSTAHKHAVSQITLNGTPYAFTYDANGNMTAGWDFTDPSSPATRTIAYNADNMPTGITHSVLGTTSFVYDGEGSRVKKTAGASATYYYGSHFEIEGAAAVKYIFAGSQRIARKTATAAFYFHQDHLGSASVVTDAAGAQVEATEYLPYGGQRSHSGTLQAPYKFTDEELDASTGLYNYNARFYDPITGRFISADTLVPDFANPQTLNRYSYCANSPLIYIDPSGHVFGIDDLIIGAAIGAAIGGVTSAASGGDIGMGMLTGAISGAIFYGAGSFIESAAQSAVYIDSWMGVQNAVQAGVGVSYGAQAAIHAGAGALAGGINSAITGNDIGMGMLTGGISGGVGKYFGSYLPNNNWGVQFAGRSLIGGVTGGISAELYGGNFNDGFFLGLKTSAIGLICNDTIHEGIIYSDYGEIKGEVGVERTNLSLKIAMTLTGGKVGWNLYRFFRYGLLFDGRKGTRIFQIRNKDTGEPYFRLDKGPVPGNEGAKLHYHRRPDLKLHRPYEGF